MGGADSGIEKGKNMGRRVLLLVLSIWMMAFPGTAASGELGKKMLREKLQGHVRALVRIGERNLWKGDSLERAAVYIEGTLRQYGHTVERQSYTQLSSGNRYDGHPRFRLHGRSREGAISYLEGNVRSCRDVAQIAVFICGDDMTGKGADRLLPHPGSRFSKKDISKTQKVKQSRRKN